MLSLVVALTAVGVAIVANYAPLHLPAPFSHISITRQPSLGVVAPLEGPLEVNTILQESRRLFEDQIVDPETVTFNEAGEMFLFTEKGIFKSRLERGTFRTLHLVFAPDGGRPLSGAFGSDGSLYVCDSQKGLWKLNVTSHQHELLLSEDVLFFCDDVVVSSQDEVFVADASSIRAPHPSLVLVTSYAAVAAGHSEGRILKYSPSTKALEVLLDNVTFANGVALSHDESYLLVSDGGSALRTLRYWLKGPKEGTVEVFVPSLPGYADGISAGSNSTFWLAVFARVDILQVLALRVRLLRWIVTYLPASIQHLVVRRHGIVIQVDQDGNFLRSFHDPKCDFGRTTSAVEHKGRLYVGGFFPFVRVLDLRPATPRAAWSDPTPQTKNQDTAFSESQ